MRRQVARIALKNELKLGSVSEPIARFRRLEARRVLDASFSFNGVDGLQLSDFDNLNGTSALDISVDGSNNLVFKLNNGFWHGTDLMGQIVGDNLQTLTVDPSLFLAGQLDLQILDNNANLLTDIDLNVTFSTALNLPDSATNGSIMLDVGGNIDINAAINTFGNSFIAVAGGSINSGPAGDITTTDDTPDEDSGSVTLTAGLNIALQGMIDTGGYPNVAGPETSDAGAITITTVNGNITTAAIDAVGGTTNDPLVMGEGGLVKLHAQDGDASGDDGDVTINGGLMTSTELPATVKVEIDAARDVTINQAMTTQGGSMDVLAGRDIVSGALGSITTTGDKPNEDSGFVTLAAGRNVTLSGAIDTSGFDNAAGPETSDAGAITISTVNGNILTQVGATLTAMGGTTTDPLVMGEGGLITLTANDKLALESNVGDITIGDAIRTSTELGKPVRVAFSAEEDIAINASITTLGGSVSVSAGRDVTSSVNGNIISTGDKPDEDSGDITISSVTVALAGNVLLQGFIIASGYNNVAGPETSAGGNVTITTVNGNITTAAIDAVGGTTSDPLVMGEGGTVRLHAQDGDALGDDGDVTINGGLMTSTELPATVKVDIDAARDVTINQAMTTQGGSVDVLAGRDILNSALGSITTTGDKPNEDSGCVVLVAGRDIHLQSGIDTRGVSFDGGLVTLPGMGGNIHIQAGRDIQIDALITALGGDSNDLDLLPNEFGGHITLLAGDDIDLNANLATNGLFETAGTVYLLAGNNLNDVMLGVDMQSGTTITTGGGNIRIVTDNEGNILLGEVNAGTGNVSLLAEGSILDNNGAAINVIADRLRMWADAVVNPDGSQGSISSTLAAVAAAGQNQVTLTSAAGFLVGNTLLLQDGDSPAQVLTIVDVTGNTLTLSANLDSEYSPAMGAAATTATEGNQLGRIGGPDTGNGTPELNAQAIDTQVTVIAARSAQGIYISEFDSVIVDATGDISVQQVNADCMLNVPPPTDRSLSDLTTTSDGPIKLVSVTGAITLNDGDDADGVSVAADGSGNLLMKAFSDIVVNAEILSGQGNLTLHAGDDLALFASVVTAAPGSIYMFAGNNAVPAGVDLAPYNGVYMGAGAPPPPNPAASINIRIVADNEGDIVLNWLDAGTGDVSLIAEGSIIDNNGGSLNVVANSLRMWADAVVNADGTQDTLSAGNFVGGIGGSDVGNGTPELNINAIDTRVVFLAAQSADGIYISEFDSVIVGATGDIHVQEVNFNSTLTARTDSSLSDLRTTDVAGHIKLVSLSGAITVDDGNPANGVGVQAVGGSSDILLRAAADLILNANVVSNSGHITLVADDDIDLNADIMTNGVSDTAGTIYLFAGNSVNDAILGVDMQSGTRIQSGAGNIRVVADNEGDVLLSQLDAGTGSVSLLAEGSILDNDLAATNVISNTLRMWADAVVDSSGNQTLVAGNQLGVIGGTGAARIDTQVAILAAQSAEGIYVSEADSVVITATGDISVRQVRFNSTLTTRTDGSLSDLVTTNDNTTIELVALTGSITLQDGDNDFIAMTTPTSSTELTATALAGSNVVQVVSAADFSVGDTVRIIDADSSVQQADITAIVGNTITLSMNWTSEYSMASARLMKQADIHLSAGGSIESMVTSDPTRAALVQGDHLRLQAGTYVHLPNTQVHTFEAQITAAQNHATLFENMAADAKGQEILDDLQHTGVMGGTMNGLPSNDVEGQRTFDQLREDFSFSHRFSSAYALFVRNAGDLTLTQQDFAQTMLITGNEPGVYIETTNDGILTVQGQSSLTSTTMQDPGIVLISGAELVIEGEITTGVSLGANYAQVLNVLDLNAEAYDGGQQIGVPPVSSHVVVRNGGPEDFDSHIFQRVSMRFGSLGEAGFMTVIHYADGAFQVFEGNEEVAILKMPSDGYTLDPNPQPGGSIRAADATAPNLFARGSVFDTAFLNNNQDLPTDVVMRRSLDFFLFSTNDQGDLVDEAAVSQEVLDVISDGNVIPIIVPNPEPVVPPLPAIPQVFEIVDIPLFLPIVEMELPYLVTREIEVAIYSVTYDDANLNGQVDSNELPTYDEVIRNGITDEANREAIPINPSQGGEEPTPDDIERKKMELLNDPNQPSGAYAIIKTDADRNQTVLDVFALRDWPEETAKDAKPGEEIKIELPRLEPFKLEELIEGPGSPVDGLDAVPPIENNSGPQDSDTGSLSPASSKMDRAPRWASSGLLLGTLWMMRTNHQSGLSQEGPAACDDEPAMAQDYSRRARRRRSIT